MDPMGLFAPEELPTQTFPGSCGYNDAPFARCNPRQHQDDMTCFGTEDPNLDIIFHWNPARPENINKKHGNQLKSTNMTFFFE